MHREKVNRVAVAALISGVIIALHLFLPLRTSVQIGADEGFELAKATLCLHGHNLYSEVWNDQPPLHTFIITQVLRHISPSILGPRLVTTIFTVLLLLALFTRAAYKKLACQKANSCQFDCMPTGGSASSGGGVAADVFLSAAVSAGKSAGVVQCVQRAEGG